MSIFGDCIVQCSLLLYSNADISQEIQFCCSRQTDSIIVSHTSAVWYKTALYSIVLLQYWAGALGQFYGDTITKLDPEVNFKLVWWCVAIFPVHARYSCPCPCTHNCPCTCPIQWSFSFLCWFFIFMFIFMFMHFPFIYSVSIQYAATKNLQNM